MLYNCECELDALDLVINEKKVVLYASNVSACVPLLVHSYHDYQKLNT